MPRTDASSLLHRALVGGAMASLLSTAVIALAAARRGQPPWAPTNATSQWLWGTSARHTQDCSWRHTGVGYAVHHVMSCWWALVYEAVRSHYPALPAATVAPVVTALAWWSDFHVVPPRFSPGFEARLPRGDRLLAYAAFGGGLLLMTQVQSTREPVTGPRDRGRATRGRTSRAAAPSPVGKRPRQRPAAAR